jgi:hypothetical protein
MKLITIRSQRTVVDRRKCDECGEDSDTLVQVGEEPDIESSTAELCLGCVKKAYDLISGECLLGWLREGKVLR